MNEPTNNRTSFDIEPGKEIFLQNSNALVKVLLTYPDGSEIEFTMGPNEEARLKVGSKMVPTINMLPADEELGDLRSVD